jgi:hypothetical protein
MKNKPLFRFLAGACCVLALSAWLHRETVHAQTISSTTSLIQMQDQFSACPCALSAVPAANTVKLVFVNGLLGAEGSDYFLAGNALTLPASLSTASVQAVYWATK